MGALGKGAYEPGWTIDVASATARLNTAAKASFSTALMPLAYGVYALYYKNTQIEPPIPDGCYDPSYGYIWHDVPSTAWHMWTTGFRKEGYARDVAPFVLGTPNLHKDVKAYPPPKLTNAMFRSPEQGGYGLPLSTFMWTAYESRPLAALPGGVPPTDLGQCRS